MQSTFFFQSCLVKDKICRAQAIFFLLFLWSGPIYSIVADVFCLRFWGNRKINQENGLFHVQVMKSTMQICHVLNAVCAEIPIWIFYLYVSQLVVQSCYKTILYSHWSVLQDYIIIFLVDLWQIFNPWIIFYCLYYVLVSLKMDWRAGSNLARF